MMRWTKYLVGFVVVALVGLVVWMPQVVPVIGEAFVGVWIDPFLELGLTLLLTFLAGYALPEGFWLWGVAAVSLRIPFEATSTGGAVEAGVLSESDVGGLILVIVITYALTILLLTASSALGAGLRSLRRRSRGAGTRRRSMTDGG